MPSESLRLRRQRGGLFNGHAHRTFVPQRPDIGRTLGGAVDLPLPTPWSIRDQGEEGSCVAYAAVACAEYFLWQSTKAITYFAEEAFDRAIRDKQKKDHVISDRTWLKEAAVLLRSLGLSSAAGDEAPMKFDSVSVNHPAHQHINPAEYVVESLRNGAPVAISIEVQVLPTGTRNWTTRLARSHGIVPDPTGPCADGHALCILGFRPDAQAPGGGWFIVRNSWGLQWSSETPSTEPFAVAGLPGRGYGVISVAYLQLHCSEVLTVTGLLS